VLLVFGGSLGARCSTSSRSTRSAQAARGPAPRGTRDYDALAPRVSRPDYRLYAFTEEFGAALGASDLALARAGGSVWELAAAGKPAVLIPARSRPATTRRRTRATSSARAARRRARGRARRAPDVVRSLLVDPERLAEMSAAMLRVARPDAADEIAEELLALAS
jgi:UDP-N-acetylglucosamine--N-acetylmuramyl-(pentapeptide) pyrophosphoryl-undecaprenol N-acetylglucosamine transferase